MPGFRQGQLSNFDPSDGSMDAFAIKQPYNTYLPDSLESADHLNHYFDAVFKLEDYLIGYAGANIQGYYPNGALISGAQLYVAQAISGFTLSSNQQTFTMTVPTLFGNSPFTDPTFSLAVRADEVPNTPSSIQGEYANTSPTSIKTWNDLLGKNYYQCILSPVSGNIFNVRVNSFNATTTPSTTTYFGEGLTSVGKAWSSYIGTVTAAAITGQLNFLSATQYQSICIVSTPGGIATETNKHFISAMPVATRSTWGGLSLDLANNKRHIGLSSTHSGGGYGGFVKLYNGINNTSSDQFIEFRIVGFASDDVVYGVPFGAVGVAIRSAGFDSTYYSGYGLLLGDQAGSESSTATATSEVSYRTGYLVRFNNANLAANTNILTTTYITSGGGALPKASATLPGCTILAGPTTLSLHSSSYDIKYKLAATGTLIALQSSVSGGGWSTVLSYNDGTGSALGDGEQGFFSIPKRSSGLSTANKWLFLDDVVYGSGSSFSPVTLNLNAFFLKTGTAANMTYSSLAQTVATTGVVEPNTNLFRWNDPSNVTVDGYRTNPKLPWEFGDGIPAQPLPGRVLMSMDWDPSGSQILDFSAVLRLPTPVDLTNDSKRLYFTMQIWRNNALSNYFGAIGNNDYELGFSKSATTSTRDVENWWDLNFTPDPQKIGYIHIPNNPDYITFSADLKFATFSVPLSLIPRVYRDGVRTIYVKGAVVANGIDGAYVSDLAVI